MLKVVSNTTPLLSLLKIGKLHLLKELYQEIIIPLEVYKEIEAGRDKAYYINLKTLDWIKILSIENTLSLSYFLDLDKGEAEAIILASEIKANLILLDEALGRFHAKHASLKVTGTAGILLKSKKNGLIKELKPLLFELREKKVWLGDDLIKNLLALAGED
jgi:uncharacterized protein